MSQTSKSINVFLTLDRNVIGGYYNKHDPSPLYKRQLSHEFEQYVMASVATAKRHSVIFYKLKCSNENDKQYAEPLMYSMRRHFLAKKQEKEVEFSKFKRRNWMLLFVSIVVVILFQGFLPLLLDSQQGVSTGLINSLDIFAWVLLWHPIDELVFHWNPYLKQINLVNKLATAEPIITENEKSVVVDNSFRIVA